MHGKKKKRTFASCTASKSRTSRPPLTVTCHQQNRSPVGPDSPPINSTMVLRDKGS